MNQKEFDKFVTGFRPERAIFFTEDPICIVRVTHKVFKPYYLEVYGIVNIQAFLPAEELTKVEVVWVHPSLELLKPGTILKGAPS